MNKWVIVFLLSYALSLSSSALAEQCPPPIGFQAIEQNYQLTELSEPVSLVNLWAVWCPPCLKELPLLDSIASSDSFGINTVHIGDNLIAIEQKFDQLNIKHLPKTIAPNLNTIYELGFQGLPATLIVLNGKAKYLYSGYLKHTPDVLSDWLTCLNEEL